MLVMIKVDIDGVNDGDIHPTSYKAGDIVDIKPDLYRAFSGLGVVEDLKEPDQEPEQEEKELIPEYENKMIEPEKTTKTTKKRGGNK